MGLLIIKEIINMKGLNMSHPLISIITCTYKKFNTIFSTIDSVLQQDYQNIEYIITDDSSDNFPYDEICEYIEKHREKNLVNYKIIQNKHNMGTVRNLNGAMKNATGKYITVLAGDDIYYSKHSISSIVERMEKNNSNLLTATRLACDDSFEPLHLLPHYLSRKVLNRKNTAKKQHELFIGGQFYAMASGSAMCYRKSFLESDGYFDEKYFLWEDGPYIERYLRNHKIDMAYDIILIKYQLGGISTSKEIPHQLMEDTKHYNVSDRVEKIYDASKFYQTLALCNIRYRTINLKDPEKIKFFLKHPYILIYKMYYRIFDKIAELYDKKIVIPRLIKKEEKNNAGN